MIDLDRFRNDIHKVDLHIHTYYSDGESGPKEIVKTAAETGRRAIAITDHDGTGGVKEAAAAGREYGIEVITGIELATEMENGTGLHILGYGFDPDDAALNDVLTDLAERRDRRNRRLINVLNEMGFDISLDELEKGRKGGFIGKPVIARALADKGYIETYEEAFRGDRIFGSPEARAVKKDKIQAAEAIKLINSAGGIAVLAHPVQTRHIGDTGSEEFYINIEKIISQLKEQGLGGLECYHPDQDTVQTERFIELADRYDLSITRGSDFHGADYRSAKPTA